MKLVNQTIAYINMAKKYDGLDIVPLDTKVLPNQDERGYAIELRGFYDIQDLEWIVRDLKKLNDNRDTGE